VQHHGDVPRPPVSTPVAGGAPGGSSYPDTYDRDLLVRRYGERRADELLALVGGHPAPGRRTRTMPVVAVIALAVVLTWVVWAWRSATTGAVTADLVGFAAPTSDTSLVVTWTVSRDPGSAVACLVTATDRSGEQVGVRGVPVLPSGDRMTQLVTDVSTVARAANASVGGCRTVAADSTTRAPTPVPTPR